MNVALFAGLDTDRAYSMDKHATCLAHALRARYSAGHSFELHYGPGIRLPLFLERSRRLSALANEGPATHILYPRQARRQQADVNHVLDHSYGSLLKALSPQRTVVTCHDLMPLQVPDIHPTFYSRMTGRRWYKRSIMAMTGAARIITVSEHTKRDLVEHTGYDAERIVVIPNGIDPEFRPTTDAARRQVVRQGLGVPEGGKIVLHVGNCAPYKNLPALFKVVSLVQHRFDRPVYLLRVGPPFTARQQKLVKELSLGSQILRRERLPLEELVELYNAADVLLFPSLYEGFGLPVAEAMACGLPVVASNVTSIPEVLGEGQLAFAPGDVEGMAEAVVALFEKPAWRQELIARGLRRVRRFSWPLVAEQVLAVYEEIWRGSGG